MFNCMDVSLQNELAAVWFLHKIKKAQYFNNFLFCQALFSNSALESTHKQLSLWVSRKWLNSKTLIQDSRTTQMTTVFMSDSFDHWFVQWHWFCNVRCLPWTLKGWLFWLCVELFSLVEEKTSNITWTNIVSKLCYFLLTCIKAISCSQSCWIIQNNYKKWNMDRDQNKAV